MTNKRPTLHERFVEWRSNKAIVVGLTVCGAFLIWLANIADAGRRLHEILETYKSGGSSPNVQIGSVIGTQNIRTGDQIGSIGQTIINSTVNSSITNNAQSKVLGQASISIGQLQSTPGKVPRSADLKQPGVTLQYEVPTVSKYFSAHPEKSAIGTAPTQLAASNALKESAGVKRYPAARNSAIVDIEHVPGQPLTPRPLPDWYQVIDFDDSFIFTHPLAKTIAIISKQDGGQSRLISLGAILPQDEYPILLHNCIDKENPETILMASDINEFSSTAYVISLLTGLIKTSEKPEKKMGRINGIVCFP